MVFQDPFSSLNPAYRVSHGILRGLKLHRPRPRPRQRARPRPSGWSRRSGCTPAAEILDRYPVRTQRRSAPADRLRPGAGLPAQADPRRRAGVDARRLHPDRAAQPDGDAARDEGVSFLYITHDIASARYVSDRLLVMYAGHIVESGPTEDVLADPQAPVHPAAAVGRTRPAGAAGGRRRHRQRRAAAR